MIPGRVIGRVVPAEILEAFRGVKLLLVQAMDEEGNDSGAVHVACDAIGANVGERVFFAQGREAAFPLPDPFNPSDATIVAIIDEISE